MALYYPFNREDVFPSFWANRIQDFLSTARTDLRLSVKNATTVQVVPDPTIGLAGIALEGRWRFNEATVEREHPGGSAGTYTVWVVATDNDVDNTPDPFTDHTDYSFELRITNGENPSGAGVEIFEKIGEITWSGAAITAIAQTHGSVTGPMIVTSALSATGDLTWSRDQAGAIIGQLKPNAVEANELADNSVDTAAIVALAVTEAKIAAEAITAGKLAPGSVTATKIGLLAVETAKLAALAVTEEKLAPESVGTAKIVNLAITAAKLAAEAVETGKIKNLAVTAAKLAAEAVETAKIQDGAVTEAKHADGSVTSRKLKPTAGVKIGPSTDVVLSGAYQNVGEPLEIAPAVLSKIQLQLSCRVTSSGDTKFDLALKIGAAADQSFYELVLVGTLAQALVVFTEFSLPVGATTLQLRARRSDGSGGAVHKVDYLYWLKAA